MAGYSGTPLPKKLGIKPMHRVALVAAPDDFPRQLAPLPQDVEIVTGLLGQKPFDVIVWFARSERDLIRRIEKTARRLTPTGGLWIAWPKKSSGVRTDLSDCVVRRIVLESGLVDNKVCAIDDVWSGLRFVVRLKDRPAKRRDG